MARQRLEIGHDSFLLNHYLVMIFDPYHSTPLTSAAEIASLNNCRSIKQRYAEMNVFKAYGKNGKE
jgi:hypothetical protein